MNWYDRVVDNLSELPSFITYYEAELHKAKDEVKIRGNLEKQLSTLPGITEERMSQLQTVENVLEHLNIQLRKIRSQQFKKFLENYNRALSSRDAEKYADGVDEVVDMESIINTVSYLRNQYLSIMKGLESKNYMLGHIVRVRTAGYQDVEL
jgi:hypothetical protein